MLLLFLAQLTSLIFGRATDEAGPCDPSFEHAHCLPSTAEKLFPPD